MLVCAAETPSGLAAPRKSQAVPNARIGTPVPERQTTIRAGQPVVITSAGRRGREIRHLNVHVRNVGRTVAKEVSVVAELEGGVVYPLKGPRHIPPEQSAVYILRSGAPLSGRGSIRVVPACTNCRR